MMKAKAIGVYIHIPFCVRKCNYCDFCSGAYDKKTKARYVDALIKEIGGYKGRGLCVDTVFFGGGTPSLLTARELEKIMSALRDSFTLTDDCEITLEANPKTLTRNSLKIALSLGVNRISLGLQSIHENELKILGRIHSFEDFLKTYSLCRELGVSNINIDLMFGIPEQTEESLDRTLSKIIELSPEHISLYGLIIEEGTPFFIQRESLNFPDEDTESRMYFSAADKLKNASYRHYEISNYALPHRESRHNLKYWNDEEYIGFGASAHSYFEGVRFGNCSSVEDYISGKGERTSEIISPEDEAFEYAMLKLRLADGIFEDEYFRRFGRYFYSERKALIDRYISCGLMEHKLGVTRFTDRGFYLSNTILSEIL